MRIDRSAGGYWLDSRLDSSFSEITEPVLSDSDARKARRLLCGQCAHTITNSAAGITIQGSHVHQFINPVGLSFEIACYATAPGCFSTGQATEQYTWFPGYRWRLAVCARCATQLGWSYHGRDGDGFYGLIRNRLREAGGTDVD
jgi:hypothetical protein